MAKKSLADQIAELNKPQTDFDIENDLYEHNIEDAEDDNSSISEDDGLKSEHYVSVSKSKLRGLDDEVKLNKKYKGSVASRKQIYEEDSVSGSQDDDENEDEIEDEDDEQENNEDDNSIDLENLAEDSDNSDDASDSDSQSEDENLTHKRNKLKDLVASERKNIISRLSQSSTSDSLKGFAIIKQHKVFDSIIETRLKAQKSLTNSNLLPFNSQLLDSLSTKKTNKYLNQAQEKCFDLLDSITKLRSKLLIEDSVISKPISQGSKKRKLSDYVAEAVKFDNILNEYRTGILTKWSAKIANSSGSTAINAGKFKAINQSSEQQVINNLTDMDRLVKRTKLNRRLIKPLGYEPSTEVDNEKTSNSKDPDIPSETSNIKSNISEINQIFDDEDFYRVILNDLVDKKIQSSNPTTGLTLTLRSAQKAQKLKKNVDTKASKGRKLKYHIQEQISNFEAPRSNLKWDDNQIDEFFASLLGQKVNMDEIHYDEDIEDDGFIVGDDSIKLFG